MTFRQRYDLLARAVPRPYGCCVSEQTDELDRLLAHWRRVRIPAALSFAILIPVAWVTILWWHSNPTDARGVVASSGFGNGTAVQDGGGQKKALATSGFANQTVADNTPKQKAVESGTTPVELLEKPKPVYTEEGRSLKLEGVVALDVVFQANGTVSVTKVVSGLGHGLDEAAVHAAQQIKFKPAKRDNENVDFPARIRIQFRLAY